MGGYSDSKSIISKDVLAKWPHLSVKTETTEVFRIPECDKINNQGHRASLFQAYILMYR